MGLVTLYLTYPRLPPWASAVRAYGASGGLTDYNRFLWVAPKGAASKQDSAGTRASSGKSVENGSRPRETALLRKAALIPAEMERIPRARQVGA